MTMCVCPPSGCRVVSCCCRFHSARCCGGRSAETGAPPKCISFHVFTLWATFLPHLLKAMYVPCKKTTKSSVDRKPQACGTFSAHHLNQAFMMIEHICYGVDSFWRSADTHLHFHQYSEVRWHFAYDVQIRKCNSSIFREVVTHLLKVLHRPCEPFYDTTALH